MISDNTYTYADGKGAKFFRNMFMPHTVLTDKHKESKAEKAKKEAMIVQSAANVREDAVSDAKSKKMLMIGIGALVVVGLGVGLFVAFKK